MTPSIETIIFSHLSGEEQYWYLEEKLKDVITDTTLRKIKIGNIMHAFNQTQVYKNNK